MSSITELVCVQCGTSYREGEVSTCPRCGPDEGILDVRFDLRRAAQTLTRQNLAQRAWSHWRYRELLPLDEAFCPTSGHLGWTPIIEAPRLAKALGIARLRLKDDGRNPSGSFKDRPSSVGVQRALQEGMETIACASTGNAASSLAYSAAVAGMACNIFVGKNVPQGKLAQLLAYGARVFRVQGTYAQAYDLCTQACEKFGWYNRNAAINPYLVEGKKTGGLEAAEQCTDDPPQWIVCSVGDGCSIAGVHKGVVEMQAVGITNWTARMLGVQAEGVAPIADAFRTGKLDRSGTGDTYADSINVPVPRNWRKAVNAVRESNGAYVTTTDAEIMRAVPLTGRLTGVFAEPAAATTIAGIAAAREQGILDAKSNVLAMITGNGLKDIAGALRAVGEPLDVPPTLEAVLAIV
ncbi:MAG TPA: threonine synthase [Pirellulales bacterium]|nr:threonine synthase [Pirellulales bacterium]